MPQNNSIEQRNLKIAGFSPRIGTFLKGRLKLFSGSGSELRLKIVYWR
jgi:hypothetical protein